MILGQFGFGCLFETVWGCLGQVETVWASFLGVNLGQLGTVWVPVLDCLGLFGTVLGKFGCLLWTRACLERFGSVSDRSGTVFD